MHELKDNETARNVQLCDCVEGNKMAMVDFPHIDRSVRHIGISKLRGLNAEKLRETEDTYVIQGENDQPLAVLLTYNKFLAMQDKMMAVVNVVDLLSNEAEVKALDAAFADVRADRIEALEDIKAELTKRRG